MENYIVSARKYRPAAFDAVVGQQQLTTTLRNAIVTGKLAHAYLFCGPRGVGKTTCARIFAKTINCEQSGRDGEPCNQCESCRSFNEQRSLNIYELDAASNNSVDDIRSLTEQVRIPPQIGRYKVYIIDEVHMLSTQAFNAFLKTLEEPPRHAIFILATTEKHKIIPTILSRCQIYDFTRIGVADIVAHLGMVAEREGIKAEPEALSVIAQKADGGMRDALSLFDQMNSFTGGDITYKKVIDNLNVLDYEYYFRFTDLFLQQKIGDSLLLLNEVLNRGFDGNIFIGGLAEHLRNLLVSHDEATLPLMQGSDALRDRYRNQSRQCKPTLLYRALKLCNDCDMNYRTARNKRLLVELTLIQLGQLASDDEAPGSGRGPVQKLKPLFGSAAAQGAPAAAPADTTAAASAAPTAPALPHAAQPADATARRTPSPAAAPPPQRAAAAPTGSGAIPVVRRGGTGFSIKRRAVLADEEAAGGARQEARTLDEQRPFTAEALLYQWNAYAGALPKEEGALQNHMYLLKPQPEPESGRFSITVDNDWVENLFKEHQPAIERYLQEQLHNGTIRMIINVNESEVKHRVYSRVDQYRLLAEKNPNLERLKEQLGLEFT